MRATQYYTTERLRRSAVVFLAAKGLTGPLNIIILLVIASRLPQAEFALYAWLFAFGEFLHRLAHGGLNWVALHYVPFYRTRVGGQAFRRFLLGLVALRLGLTAALAAVCFLVAPYVVGTLGSEAWLFPFRLYLAVLVADLTAEFLRTCVFAPLLKQGMVQANVLLQNGVVLVGLLLVPLIGATALSIKEVIYAHLAGTGLALLLAFVQLGHLIRNQDVAFAPSEPPPTWRRLFRFAANNYTHDIVRLSSSGQVVTMLGARLIGVPALATFGFARTLTGHLHKLLPAQLLMGLLRPKIIAAYLSDRSFRELNLRAVLILKISNCVLATGVAVIVVYGVPILGYLSAGKYSDSYGLVLVFLLWLAVINLEAVLSVVANVIERPEILRRASSASLLVVPAAVTLTYFGAGAYGLVWAMVVGEAAFVALVFLQLRRLGHRFAFDMDGHARIAGAMLAAVAGGTFVQHLLPEAVVAVALGAVVIVVTFIVALRVLRPFAAAERQAIERLVGWRLVLL